MGSIVRFEMKMKGIQTSFLFGKIYIIFFSDTEFTESASFLSEMNRNYLNSQQRS